MNEDKKDLRGFGSHLGSLITVWSTGEYELVNPATDKPYDDTPPIKMQVGDPLVGGVNGFVIEDLLNIAIDRITAYDAFEPDAMNASAVNMIRQALLNLRVREDRKRALSQKSDKS